MRLILFGSEIPPALAGELAANGLEPERAAEAEPDGNGAVAALATALRGAEATLRGADIACVLVAGSGDPALGAALSSVKLEIPTVWVAPAGDSDDPELIGRVADLTLDATGDATTSARAIRDLVGPKLPSP